MEGKREGLSTPDARRAFWVSCFKENQRAPTEGGVLEVVNMMSRRKKKSPRAPGRPRGGEKGTENSGKKPKTRFPIRHSVKARKGLGLG